MNRIVMKGGGGVVIIPEASEERIREEGETAVLAGDTVGGLVYVYNRVGYGLVVATSDAPIEISRERE